MTKLTFFKDGNDFVGFECTGHSGYAQSGSDIVCAAASTAVQLVVAYLTRYYSDNISLSVDDNDAVIKLSCVKCFEEANKQIAILFDFAKSLFEQYPDYFTFYFLEV